MIFVDISVTCTLCYYFNTVAPIGAVMGLLGVFIIIIIIIILKR